MLRSAVVNEAKVSSPIYLTSFHQLDSLKRATYVAEIHNVNWNLIHEMFKVLSIAFHSNHWRKYLSQSQKSKSTVEFFLNSIVEIQEHFFFFLHFLQLNMSFCMFRIVSSLKNTAHTQTIYHSPAISRTSSGSCFLSRLKYNCLLRIWEKPKSIMSSTVSNQILQQLASSAEIDLKKKSINVTVL